MTRVRPLLTALSAKRLDGIILSSWPNISYVTGFRSRDSFLLVSPRGCVYFTDSRYTEDARRSLKGIRVKECRLPVWQEICRQIFQLKLKAVGYEEKSLSAAAYRQLAHLCRSRTRLVPAQGLVEELREVKSPEEIALIRKSCAITVNALKYAASLVRPGMREIELAGELERFIRYNGASTASFDIIVASGPNTSLPHHATSDRAIRDNEHIYIDMGVEYQGYTSDLTRVFFVGKIASSVKTVYKTAVEAQARAIACVRPGAEISDIDACCRSHIVSRGYGRYFGHAAGHGVGLEVHEAPRIAKTTDSRLREGMVFTIEPGIYIPRKYGVRIEDMVLVTREGSEVLSGSLNK